MNKPYLGLYEPIWRNIKMTDEKPEVQPSALSVVAETSLTTFTGDKSAISLHNFDGDEYDQLELTSIVAAGGEGATIDHVDKEFYIVYWYVHFIDDHDDEGNPITYPQVIFVDPEHKTYAFHAKGVFQSLQSLINMRGNGPYREHPQKAIVRHKLTNKLKRNWFWLEFPRPEKVVPPVAD